LNKVKTLGAAFAGIALAVRRALARIISNLGWSFARRIEVIFAWTLDYARRD
jgi:hypothetical protein